MSESTPYPDLPNAVLDQMVEYLFRDSNPYKFKSILYPGCGNGELIGAVERYCDHTSAYEMPEGHAIETDDAFLETAKTRYADAPVTFYNRDYLGDLSFLPQKQFDFIISNPPALRWDQLSPTKREDYAQRFTTITETQASVPSDLLFLEQSLGLLKSDGELVFVMPETTIGPERGEYLSRQLATYNITAVETLDPETAFPEAAIPHLIVAFSNDTVQEAAPLPFDAIEQESELPKIFDVTAAGLMTAPVDTIPYDTPAATAYIDLVKNDYDATVVVDDAGTPIGYISRAMLHTEVNGTVSDVANELRSDVLLAPDASVETVLSTLHVNRFQFVGTPDRIDGIVTRFNLNEMPLYLNLFMKTAKLEYGLRTAIRNVENWEAQTETTISSSAKRHLVHDKLSLATLGELINIAEDTDVVPQISGVDVDLDDLDDLRNDIAHYNPLVYTMASDSSGRHERTAPQLFQEHQVLTTSIHRLHK